MTGGEHTTNAYTWTIEADAKHLSKTRETTRQILEGWGINHLADDLCLVVSELVANAIVHGSAPITISLRFMSGILTGDIADGGDGVPQIVHAGTYGESGRGLAIVEDVTDKWGVTHVPGRAGKVLWFLVDPARAA